MDDSLPPRRFTHGSLHHIARAIEGRPQCAETTVCRLLCGASGISFPTTPAWDSNLQKLEMSGGLTGRSGPQASSFSEESIHLVISHIAAPRGRADRRATSMDDFHEHHHNRRIRRPSPNQRRPEAHSRESVWVVRGDAQGAVPPPRANRPANSGLAREGHCRDH